MKSPQHTKTGTMNRISNEIDIQYRERHTFVNLTCPLLSVSVKTSTWQLMADPHNTPRLLSLGIFVMLLRIENPGCRRASICSTDMILYVTYFSFWEEIDPGCRIVAFEFVVP